MDVSSKAQMTEALRNAGLPEHPSMIIGRQFSASYHTDSGQVIIYGLITGFVIQPSPLTVNPRELTVFTNIPYGNPGSKIEFTRKEGEPPGKWHGSHGFEIFLEV